MLKDLLSSKIASRSALEVGIQTLIEFSTNNSLLSVAALWGELWGKITARPTAIAKKQVIDLAFNLAIYFDSHFIIDFVIDLVSGFGEE